MCYPFYQTKNLKKTDWVLEWKEEDSKLEIKLQPHDQHDECSLDQKLV